MDKNQIEFERTLLRSRDTITPHAYEIAKAAVEKAEALGLHIEAVSIETRSPYHQFADIKISVKRNPYSEEIRTEADGSERIELRRLESYPALRE